MNDAKENMEGHFLPERFLPILRELHALGYKSLRFLSYVRWNGYLSLSLYLEMPLKARTGEALVYPWRYHRELGRDLYPRHSATRFDDWLNTSSSRDAAVAFAAMFLNDLPMSQGCFDAEYAHWLEQLIALCPCGRFPVTESFSPPDGPKSHLAIRFYPCCDGTGDSLEEAPDLPLPPGLRNATDPFADFALAMDEKSRFEKEKRGDGFRQWSRKLNPKPGRL